MDADRCPHLTLLKDVPHDGFVQNLRCDAPKLRDMKYCVQHQREAEARVTRVRQIIAAR